MSTSACLLLTLLFSLGPLAYIPKGRTLGDIGDDPSACHFTLRTRVEVIFVFRISQAALPGPRRLRPSVVVNRPLTSGQLPRCHDRPAGCSEPQSRTVICTSS
ncbi:hypothetical protein BKA82DRAFT_4205984 [Pisolithus tinctorius]|nr:hypothetical protein BKA82DRAFT_4205984 [Pisolithus tinctorius]